MKFVQKANDELDIEFGQPSDRTESLTSLFSVATDALHDGIIICDQEGKVVWINASAHKTCRIEWNSFEGKTITNLVNDSAFPMDGVSEAFANNDSLVYIEEAYSGSDYIVDIKRIMEPDSAKLFFVVCLKNVNLFHKAIQNENIERSIASSGLTGPDVRKKFRDTVFDDDLETLVNLGVKAWTYGSHILISGESGVGKSQYARTLDKKVNRTGKGFVHVNCASIPESLFESELFGYEPGSFTGAHVKGKKGLVELAEQGTLFLDEVGEIPIACQAKILRFLDDGKYMKVGATKPRQANVHIISATNRNLQKMVEEGVFRADLYFRLKTVEVRVPPLRKRRELISTLIRKYLDYVDETHDRKVEIANACEQFLGVYEYPGNIRELENALQHMAILCDETMELEHLPEMAKEAAERLGYLSKNSVDDCSSSPDTPVVTSPLTDADYEPAPLKIMVKRYEREVINRMIKLHGSKRGAARALGVDIATIVRKTR